jgi:hypothetical protein
MDGVAKSSFCNTIFFPGYFLDVMKNAWVFNYLLYCPGLKGFFLNVILLLAGSRSRLETDVD